MSCQDVDLKEYLLGEANQGEKTRVADHVAACGACREEMERLKLTQMALGTLRDEEPPQRIAFVSDKVFEPRWWQRLFGSGPALAFASAFVLALAILAHGALARPVVSTSAVNTAEIERRLEQKLDQRVQAAVTKAVADVEAQDQQKTAQLLAATEQRFADQRRADLIAFDQNMEILYKRTALDRKLAMATPQEGNQQ